MKFNFNKALWAISTLAFISCGDDDSTTVIANKNKADAYIQFENTFDGRAFELNKDYETSTNGTINVSTLKYLISDIKFFGVEGTKDYTLPTEVSFHIVDQSCEATLKKYITSLPNGTYNKVSLLYGVSEEIHEKGTESQGTVLATAKAFGMDWGWTLGYRFLTFEGTFGTDHKQNFTVHNGSHGSTTGGNGHGHEAKGLDNRIVNSKTITIDFSNTNGILVSDETSPKVHLNIDIAKILKGQHDLKLSDYDGTIVIRDESTLVAQNIVTAFDLDHIHATDPNFNVPVLEECKTSNPNEGGHDHKDGKDSHEEGDNHDHTTKEKSEESHSQNA